MNVPGTVACASVITKDCRTARGDQEAIDEAIARVRKAMIQTLDKSSQDSDYTFFLAFTVDRKGRREIG